MAEPGIVLRADLSAEPLDVGGHLDMVRTSTVGAVASFVGTVRDHSPDAAGEVVELEYSAHPDAPAALAAIADRVAAQFEGVRLAVSHRTGVLAVGDVAIVAAAADSHRGEAFDACRALVEAVKAELPVWKKQVVADGSHTWVGSA
ncbi:molybdenum cofactor biosynthesis protein MoaE [Pseudactinotalea terrae]|uniref:molybdenum cofactor biosynthesis protein MoaE n=1 Tax=Pseudactinotalea terrae TaxID=1743262 RepID=UPI0012E0D35B|nr:molybdenum cofactor biosynthesis protein MoaE [Pseudactinotalea terrae]